jgi:hypothetical protein
MREREAGSPDARTEIHRSLPWPGIGRRREQDRIVPEAMATLGLAER